LGNIFFGDVDIQICPQPAQTAARLLRAAVPFVEEVHKVQNFLLLLRRQIAELFKNLLFEGYKSLSADLRLFKACWT
jgi:hypothetical protein